MNLWDAAQNGNVEVIKEFLAENVNINSTNLSGSSALMYASTYSNTTSSLEIVKLLLEYGADVNLLNRIGYTALMFASNYSNSTSSLETVKLLLKYGADVNLQNNNGNTALMGASNNETILLLLEYGADINVQNNIGKRPLSSAASIETVLLLLDHGADPFIDTTLMACQSEECLRAVETAAWNQLFKRDLQTAQVLGKSILNKDVWQLILLNERQRMLCNNPDKPTNKYLLEAFAIQLGADTEKVKNMTKNQLCALISRNIGRSTKDAEVEIRLAKKELQKKSEELKTLARKFNIDTDRDLTQIIVDISKRLN